MNEIPTKTFIAKEDEDDRSDSLEFEELTPTHKKFGIPIDEMLERLEAADLDSDNFDIYAEFISALTLLIDDQKSRDMSKESIKFGIEQLCVIAKENPELSHDISNALMNIAMGAISAANEIACQATALENLTQGNIFRANALKTEQIARARIIAAQLWDADEGREFRLKDAALIVIDTLGREGVKVSGIEQVKKWIRPVAPAYATKGGRPKKL
tara:strand:+ start:1627 stop:2268 length:642 start_codon:yes stop_codon:yes gene_type:complete